MSRGSQCRLRGHIWLLALVPLALPLLIGACSGPETTTNAVQTSNAESADLTGVDVTVHQAVG